jgi:hypothetical protein
VSRREVVLAARTRIQPAVAGRRPPRASDRDRRRPLTALERLCPYRGCEDRAPAFRKPVTGRGDRPRCRPVPAVGASAWFSRGARFDEPGLVGVHDGLRSVAKVELGEDMRDVGLDRRLGPQPCSENQAAARRNVAETVIAFSAECSSQEASRVWPSTPPITTAQSGAWSDAPPSSAGG